MSRVGDQMTEQMTKHLRIHYDYVSHGCVTELLD